MARSDLSLEAQIRKSWETCFFATPHNFANAPHFVALTQLRPTKTGSKGFFKNCSKFLRNPECERIFWVYAPQNFPIEKNFGYGAIYEKVPFFNDFLVHTPKKVLGSCTHNFDATDLRNS